MVILSHYLGTIPPHLPDTAPWLITTQAEAIVSSLIHSLPAEYHIHNGIAIHTTAIVESAAVIKAPCIIGAHCFIAAGAYLRGGVWLDDHVIIGPSSEIKSSFICAGSKAAHFNFIGDSIIGKDVNIEAGAIIANYRNEMEEKQIQCCINGKLIDTSVIKFGSLIGDNTKIGANAVLAPGTILASDTIVKRLALVDQLENIRPCQ